MGIEVRPFILCDEHGCNMSFHNHDANYNLNHLFVYAEKAGWKYVGKGRWICPECIAARNNS